MAKMYYEKDCDLGKLVDIGLSAHGDIDAFWQIFDERMELCHRALRCRHERLLGTPSDVAPILWQYGALARLEKGEVIDKLLYNGYSTLSLGYAGLWECVRSLNGKKLTEPEGEELGLEIMRKLNEYTAKWKETENIDHSLYGTPLESRFQALSPGGAISYVEVPNMNDNPEAVMQVMKFIYDNILYAELNTKSDYCQVCG